MENQTNNMNQNKLFFFFSNKYQADSNSDDLFLQAKAYDQGIGVETDKQKAAMLYQKAMEQGDMRAKMNLAMMYIYENVEAGSPEQGLQMLRELAEEGKGESKGIALFNLGCCYCWGMAVALDKQKALELWEQASEAGCAEADYSIGTYYNNELHDMERGLEYFEKAAMKGSVMANHILAQLYEEGMGVEQDLEKSFVYVGRLAELGDAVSQFKYGYYLIYCQEEFAEGVKWLRESAKAGVEPAMEKLCELGIEQEMTTYERINLLLDAPSQEEGQVVFNKMCKCCRLGDAEAQYIMGCMLYDGIRVVKDEKNGLELLRRSANNGRVDAMSQLGTILSEQHRYEEANHYLRMAAEKGNVNALHNLGTNYFFARGVEEDKAKGVELWEKGAEKNNPCSLFLLGECYLTGDFVPQNIDKAIEYYALSAKHGYQRAVERLIEVYDQLGNQQMKEFWRRKLEK